MESNEENIQLMLDSLVYLREELIRVNTGHEKIIADLTSIIFTAFNKNHHMCYYIYKKIYTSDIIGNLTMSKTTEEYVESRIKWLNKMIKKQIHSPKLITNGS